MANVMKPKNYFLWDSRSSILAFLFLTLFAQISMKSNNSRPYLKVKKNALRRHAVLMTGAIRDLKHCFPTFLALFNATKSGLDIYAILSPSTGAWHESHAYSFESDMEAVGWLLDLPSRDNRITLQYFELDDQPFNFSSGISSLFPRLGSYPSKPSKPVLLDNWKQYLAWQRMLQNCEEAGWYSDSESGCYDYIVRFRPDSCFHNNFEHFPNGIDLDSLGTQILFPFDSPTLYTPNLNTSFAACSETAISISEYDEVVHILYTPDFWNNWGGPTDIFDFGTWDTMELFFTRSIFYDKLYLDYGYPILSELMVKCGSLEVARERSFRLEGKHLHKILHVPLKLSFCRRWGGDIMCTGRANCFSLNGAMHSTKNGGMYVGCPGQSIPFFDF